MRVPAVIAPRSVSTCAPSSETWSVVGASGSGSACRPWRARWRLRLPTRSGRCRGRLELRADVALERVGVPGPRRERLHRRELADRRAGLLGVVVEGGVGYPGAALAPGLGIERVEAVRDDRDPVDLAPEPDLAGRVARQVDDREARHLVALADGARDPDRSAVPGPQQPRHEESSLRVEQ